MDHEKIVDFCNEASCPPDVGDTAEALLDWLANCGPEPALHALRDTLTDMCRIAGTREPAFSTAFEAWHSADGVALSAAILRIAKRHSITSQQGKGFARRIEGAFAAYANHAQHFGVVQAETAGNTTRPSLGG